VSTTVAYERSIRAGDGLAEQAITWGRREENPKPVALTGRDLRLMALLHDVNYLSTSQLTLLGWGRDSNAANRRLRLLHAAGHLDKFRAHTRAGSNEWTYRIARQGWQALNDHGLTTETRYTPPELHSISYAEHDLQLNALIIHIAQTTAPRQADTGLIERMPFTWRGPRTGRIEPPSSKPPTTPGLPADTHLHPEQSRAGYLEPDATLIAGEEGRRFAILIEYDRTRRPHKQIDRLRRYDRWLLHQWEEGGYASHAMPPTLLLLTDQEKSLHNLVGAADQALAAWHGPPNITADQGTHPARQRIILTSRARILGGDWTVHRPPNLPPNIRRQVKSAPRTIAYDLPTLLASQ
jgi:hypothetical protein